MKGKKIKFFFGLDPHPRRNIVPYLYCCNSNCRGVISVKENLGNNKMYNMNAKKDPDNFHGGAICSFV